jgi:hypothetical protein
VCWEWQAADGVMGKSRFDGAKRGPNPTAGGYVPHIRRIGEEKKDGWGRKTHPARRWVS